MYYPSLRLILCLGAQYHYRYQGARLLTQTPAVSSTKRLRASIPLQGARYGTFCWLSEPIDPFFSLLICKCYWCCFPLIITLADDGTYSLDEAEILSDHVAILSRGQLKAEGSVTTLTNTLGGPYRIHLGQHDSARQIPEIDGLRAHANYEGTVLETSDPRILAAAVDALNERSIADYHIQGPRIEDVFLKLADEMQGHEGLARDLGVTRQTGEVAEATDDSQLHTMGNRKALVLETGIGTSVLRQTWVLFGKRCTLLPNNYMPYFWALFVPLVTAGMAQRFFIGWDYPEGLPCRPSPLLGSYAAIQYPSSYSFYGQEFVYGPPDRIPLQNYNATLVREGRRYSARLNASQTPTVDTLSSFNQYVTAHTSDLYIGAMFDDASGLTLAWSGGSSSMGVSGAAFLQNFANSVTSGQPIYMSYSDFANPTSNQNGITILIAALTTLGFTIYPGLFALYPIAERIRKVRAMHYPNGISSPSLWLAYVLFDGLFILVISGVATMIWKFTWAYWYGLGYVFVVFFLFGLSSTMFSYVVSLFAPSQLAAIAMSTVVQFIISMLFLLA